MELHLPKNGQGAVGTSGKQTACANTFRTSPLFEK
jgi:hypothetical protein